jgi:probable HAF family extracellular repeat protein
MEPTELCAPSACYVGYTAKDIGTLGGLRASVNAINDAGVVVGWSELQSGLHHAFRYSDGAMLDLGTLPGDKESYAVGTNEAGEIVGTSVGIGIRAFLWRPWVQPGVPHMKDLGPLAGARPGDVQAGGINNNGEVVGRACCIGISSDVDVAFRWTSAGMAQLRGLYAGAFDLNDEGLAVGAVSMANQSSHAAKANCRQPSAPAAVTLLRRCWGGAGSQYLRDHRGESPYGSGLYGSGRDLEKPPLRFLTAA